VSAELRVVVGGGNGDSFAMKFVAEDTERAAGMKIGGYDEDALGAFMSEASRNVMRFLESG